MKSKNYSYLKQNKMKKLVRTEKQFNKETLEQEQDFVKRLVSLGGMHSSPLKGNWEDFTLQERFRGVSETGSSSVYPWDDENVKEGYTKELYAVDLDYKKFDCSVVVRQNGTVQGRYTESARAQYAANPCELVNLFLEYGYVELK